MSRIGYTGFFFLYSFLHMCLFIFRRPVAHCPVDAVTGARGVKDSGNCSVLQQRLELDRRRGGRGGDRARCCCGGSSALLSVSVAVLRFLLVALCFFLLVCK